MNKVYNKIIENILDCEDKHELSDVIWGSFYDLDKKCNKSCGTKIKIGLINTQCGGSGDVIFGIKLRNFLIKWYNVDVTIIATVKESVIRLGEDPKYVVGLVGTKSKNLQCRRLRFLSLEKNVPKQDLLFIAPMQMDFAPDLNDVKSLFPYANIFNTFSFSEYNDVLDKNFTFNTGIGEDRDGIFITKVKIPSKRLENLKNPYALVYVAESIDNVYNCILGFAELVSKKYSSGQYNYKKFDIVVPKWFTKINKKFINKLNIYYDNINIILPDKSLNKIYEGNGKTVLTFRADILPVPNATMLNIMKNSVKDILLTGDQSISDVLSCCPSKNLWYQIAGWKEDLADELAILLPNKYLKSVKTSCGTIKGIHYKSNYQKFIKDWNFKNIAKPKLDAIILSSIALKKDKRIKELSELVLKSKSLDRLKDKVEEIIDN